MSPSSLRSTLVLLCSCAALSACAQPRQLTILHVNDMHTHYLPEPAEWVKEDPKPLTGGMVALQEAVAREKAGASATLVLDAGDWLTGTPLSEVEAEGVKGGAFIQMMNRVGFDAATIGNHDFDNGVETLPKLIGLASFPVVSANLRRDGELLAPAPWLVLERGGLKIGVVGLILDDLAQEVSREMMRGIEVRPVAETAREAIAELDPQTDLIVLLTHQGWREDSLLATQLTGADVIIGGHSHTRLKTPQLVNGVLVAQAGSSARDLGRLDLTVEDDRVTAHEGRLIPLFQRDVKNPDPELAALVKTHEERIDAEYAVVIGHAATDFGRNYYKESALGDLMSDLLLGITGADVALLNSGGLRADLKSGPVSRLDIKQILPFANTIVLFRATGAELLTLLRTNAKASLHEEQGILQLAGIRCAYREGAAGVEILEPTVAGQPLDPGAVYTVATVDYVLGLGAKYMGFEPAAHESRSGTLFTAVAEWIAAHPELEAPAGGRFTHRP
ncbi:MAG: bifunctional UDP-sugar hydrolase/5'-nucleotidase [Candidatus Delongbacteria bacterium]